MSIGRVHSPAHPGKSVKQMADSDGSGARTFINPVYSRSFPDPFVLKYCGEYFAYSTGFARDGNVFEVIRSGDLIAWTELGGAMTPLESSPPYYWAPEVTYDNGKFYLYYSAGNEVLMEVRVAVSDRPDGGFVDSGKRLTSEDFAIDAHVFVDEDGTRYLFYATDFLEHTHVGTGTVVDRMLDPLTLEGNPRPVTRARYDWQVYDPHRKEKGGVRWHTVEGPTVLKRKGIYYEMFSGGNWQNTTYGVSFAISDSLKNPDEWRQFSDGENVLPILRTMPERIIGPGHNSVVRGPNNRELYCVYHRWVEGQRVMAIDRMDFAGTRIFIVGPTDTVQPAPFTPAVLDRFRRGDRSRAMKLNNLPDSFLMELTCSFDESPDAHGSFRIELGSPAVIVDVNPTDRTFGLQGGERLPIPDDFIWTAPHLFRIEVDIRRVSIELDDVSRRIVTLIDHPIRDITIIMVPRSLDVTYGFEELFDHDDPLEENGWTIEGEARCNIRRGELFIEASNEVLLSKGEAASDVEFVANLRIVEGMSLPNNFGLVALDSDDVVFRLSLDPTSRMIEITGGTTASTPLPDDVQLEQYHQLRFVKWGERVSCFFDDICVGEFPIRDARVRPALFARRGAIAVEMVRLTLI